MCLCVHVCDYDSLGQAPRSCFNLHANALRCWRSIGMKREAKKVINLSYFFYFFFSMQPAQRAYSIGCMISAAFYLSTALSFALLVFNKEDEHWQVIVALVAAYSKKKKKKKKKKKRNCFKYYLFLVNLKSIFFQCF